MDKVNKLEFEIFEVSGFQKKSDSSSSNKEAPQAPQTNENVAIAFSAKIVGMLREKMKKHNKANPNKKVTLSELKKVYTSGATSFSTSSYPDNTRGEVSLARVNMFLSIKNQKDAYKNDLTHLSQASFSHMTGLQLEEEEQENKTIFDVTDNLTPSKQDFALATEDIHNNNLDYDFQDVHELYLDDYKPVGFLWE